MNHVKSKDAKISGSESDSRPIATFDIETDPFKNGRIIKPFCCGFYTGQTYIDFWGADCISRFADYLSTLEEKYLIYAHNGGKFDFIFLLRLGLLENPIKIINNRVVSAHIHGHELRDSYALVPVALSDYKKDDIDYSWFEKENREAHRGDILHYLAKDCEYLHELIVGFTEKVGRKLTVGSAAFAQVKKFGPVKKTFESHDTKFRKFYVGGRVQAFEIGVFSEPFRCYDINSLYPSEMCKQHPIGQAYEYFDGRSAFDNIDCENPYFIDLTCWSSGALPLREKLGISFPIGRYRFLTTSHELKAGLELGFIDIDDIHAMHVCVDTADYSEFVDHWGRIKIQAKIDGDRCAYITAKCISNSAYGKFGQNPDNFYDYKILGDECILPGLDGWELCADYGDVEIWRCPSASSTFNDVAIAASITGSARATLMRGLSAATRAIYCDTDSIICQELNTDNIHPTKLGAWDLEFESVKTAIAGKKLYCMTDKDGNHKISSKGCRLTPAELHKLARGESVIWNSEAPTINFRNTSGYKYMRRVIGGK